MTLAESIYRSSLNLPEPAAREALDFIQFLEMRYGLSGNVLPDRAREEKRATALKKLANIRFHFEGKPVANREELYDGARG